MDTYIIKTDDNGLEQWNNIFSGPGITSKQGSSIEQTTGGGYIICGSYIGGGNQKDDVLLIKTNSTGVEQWTNTFFGNNYDEVGNCVQQTNDGGFIICGNKSYNTYSEVLLIKTDGNGNPLWNKTYGNPYSNTGNYVEQTTDGGYIICGNHNSNVYLIKTDSQGDTLWTNTFGDNTHYESSYCVQQTTDGDLLFVETKH